MPKKVRDLIALIILPISITRNLIEKKGNLKRHNVARCIIRSYTSILSSIIEKVITTRHILQYTEFVANYLHAQVIITYCCASSYAADPSILSLFRILVRYFTAFYWRILHSAYVPLFNVLSTANKIHMHRG